MKDQYVSLPDPVVVTIKVYPDGTTVIMDDITIGVPAAVTVVAGAVVLITDGFKDDGGGVYVLAWLVLVTLT